MPRTYTTDGHAQEAERIIGMRLYELRVTPSAYATLWPDDATPRTAHPVRFRRALVGWPTIPLGISRTAR